MNRHKHLASSGSSLPGSLKRGIGKLTRLLPERLEMRLNPAKFGFTAKDVPGPIQAPAGDIRLYIAPVNYAGQAFRWARAAERIDGVRAMNMNHVHETRGFGFEADYAVPVNVFAKSRRWQRAQWRSVVSGFTHVLVEAERPMFGSLFANDVEREVDALRAQGIKVGMVIHGTDARLPNAHREREPWSPYAYMAAADVDRMESLAEKNRAVLRSIGAPVFVSTTGSLLDWPDAEWLPVVVDPGRWVTDAPTLERKRPVVVHVPSSSVIKGTQLIEPVLQLLDAEGTIEYRRITGLHSSKMPDAYRSADIVLDSFLTGHYGAATCEALAASRVVVANVHEFGRSLVASRFGVELPVVQATPDTVREVLLDIVQRREHYSQLASRGPEFVERIHDGRVSANALASFLGRTVG